MAEPYWTLGEDREIEEGSFDLRAFAEEHDLAVGEARQIVEEAGCDRRTADRLANRLKKW
jgi:hypothetical protein